MSSNIRQENKIYQLLEWDTDVLGISVASILTKDLDQRQLTTLLDELKQQGVALVYWPVEVSKEISLDAAYACGGVLADKKITYRAKLHELLLKKTESPSGDQPPWRGENDSWQIAMPQGVHEHRSQEVTAELLSLAYAIGGESRFFLDIHFDRDAYQKIYKAWLANSLKRKVADQMFVSSQHDKVVAMITLLIKEGIGKIPLIAVLPEYRGKGVSTRLLDAACHYFSANDCQQLEVVTQQTNLAACSLYEKYGFNKYKLEHFYHFWL